MFSTLKKIATAAIIVSVFNIIGSIALYVIVQDNTLDFVLEFSSLLFLFSTSVIFLLFSCGMLGLCNDLEYQHGYLLKKNVELKNRVEELERISRNS